MASLTLGRTNLQVNKNGFGALPIQRISEYEAVYLLRKACDNGINFYDTARIYSDSEHKIGVAFSGCRDKVIISSKTFSTTPDGFWQDLDTSLKMLKTDYIDIYKFQTPAFCPLPDDGKGLYEAMLKAKEQGKIRFIGMSNHRLPVALEAVSSGYYDVIQFPFSYLADAKDEALVELSQQKNVGFVCMKSLSGGLIDRADAAYAYLNQFNALPIWGIQRESELDQFIGFDTNPPQMTEEIKKVIARDREQLVGDFCRGCGYCMPCPVGIEINNSARMSLLLKRAPAAFYLSEDWQKKMARIDNCTNCGHCTSHCPYGLDTPSLLKKNLADYRTYFK